MGQWRFQDTDLAEIQEWIDTTPEKFTEANLMEMSASEPSPDEEEDVVGAMPQSKMTLDHLPEAFQFFKTAFDFFYNIDLSAIWTLKPQPIVKGGLVLYRHIFRGMKEQKGQTEITMYFHKVTPCAFRFCFPFYLLHLPSSAIRHSKTSTFSFPPSAFSSAYRPWRWPGWWSTST